MVGYILVNEYEECCYENGQEKDVKFGEAFVIGVVGKGQSIGYCLVSVGSESWLSMCALFAMRLALDNCYDFHAAYRVVKVGFCHPV